MKQTTGFEKSILLGSIKNRLTEDMTVRDWDKIAKQFQCPPSHTLIYTFGSWNNVKKALGYKGNHIRYSKKELEEIALKHKAYFSSKREWSEYAKKQELPTDLVYIKAYGTWNKAKQLIGIDTPARKKPTTYTKKNIEEIIKKNSDYMKTKSTWDDFVKGKPLPTYKTIVKYFSWDEAKQISDTKISNKKEDKLH